MVRRPSPREGAQIAGWQGQSLNARKCVILSLEGRNGKTRIPTTRLWEVADVSVDECLLPHLSPTPGQGAALQMKYLGRIVRVADLAKLRRSGIFDREACLGKTFSRAVEELVDEVRRDTSGAPKAGVPPPVQ